MTLLVTVTSAGEVWEPVKHSTFGCKPVLNLSIGRLLTPSFRPFGVLRIHSSRNPSETNQRYDLGPAPNVESLERLVGEDTNVQVALYVFIFLHRTFPKLWRQFHKVNRRSKARSYYAGLHAGLNDQLLRRRRAVENDTGLVLATDSKLPAAVEIHFGETNARSSRPERTRYSKAFAAGFVTGRNLAINSAVESRRGPQSETRRIS